MDTQTTSELARVNQALHREVAERQRTEDALRASETELRLTLDSIPAGIIVVSPETGITDANKQLLDYLGHTMEALKR